MISFYLKYSFYISVHIIFVACINFYGYSNPIEADRMIFKNSMFFLDTCWLWEADIWGDGEIEIMH